ncbi:DUF4349 domain-containing protein [Lachnospiraceae bacterium OttesenSCG-928-E19]|nr:DUF4349 domain-containing protein [Lachnospiraceae bacterium OttesenSCG-928-E19]
MFKKILIFVLVLGLVGCGSFGKKTSTVARKSAASSVDSYQKSTYDVNAAKKLKFAYTTSVDLQSNDFNDAKNKIEDRIKLINGYISEETDSRMIVRIPSPELDNFLTFLEDKVGNIKNKKTIANVINELDNEIDEKLKNLRETRDRYMVMLDKTTKLSDVISLEKQLEKINSQIMDLELQLKRADQNVQYAEITINLKQYVTKVGIALRAALWGAIILLMVL